jgi:hypothetical protein
VVRRVTHSEEWWEMLAPPTVIRCEGHYKDGLRCRREAHPGATVCRMHGGAAKQVREAAAARIGNAADEMVKRLQNMLDDPDVEARDKIKIAQDLLDRAGLNATGKLLVGVAEVDPVEKLFRDLLSEPANLAPPVTAVQEPLPPARSGSPPGLPSGVGDEEIFDAEIVEEPEGDAEVVHRLPPAHIRRDLERLGLL